MGKLAFLSISVLYIAALFTCALSVHLESLKDQKCLKTPPKVTEVDSEWASTVGTWHVNHGSLLHLYRTAADVASVPVEDLTSHDLYYESCLRFKWGPDHTIVSGHGEKVVDCQLKPSGSEDGSSTFRYSNLDLDGVAWPVLTDNKNFIMFYVCWPKGQEASWAAISKEAGLSKKIMKKIHAKARGLGFDEKKFTTIRYESCGVDGEEEEDEDEGKDEL